MTLHGETARIRAFQEDLLKMSDTHFIRRACIQNSLEYGDDWSFSVIHNVSLC